MVMSDSDGDDEVGKKEREQVMDKKGNGIVLDDKAKVVEARWHWDHRVMLNLYTVN